MSYILDNIVIKFEYYRYRQVQNGSNYQLEWHLTIEFLIDDQIELLKIYESRFGYRNTTGSVFQKW